MKQRKRWTGVRVVNLTAVVLLASAWFVIPGRAAPPAGAAESPASEQAPVWVVGTKQAPPFAIRNPDGTWRGIAIDLWRTAADDLGYRYIFREQPLDELLRGVADGSLDVGVAAITITAEREQSLDFSQPYFITGLGIAVPDGQDRGWIAALLPFFSLAFFKAVVGLVLLLLAAGALVWLFERRRNTDEFDEGLGRGLLAGFWWAAVTMTTVGYGDKAPRSTGGRLVGVIWMFTGVIVISGFTAAITSSLTVNRLQGPVQGPNDLPQARVGAVEASTSSAYLSSQHMSFTSYDSLDAALIALKQGQLDAVVHDAPILRYMIAREFRGHLRVLPAIFDQQYYGIALPPQSPHREALDRAILNHINSPQWQATLNRYLGQ